MAQADNLERDDAIETLLPGSINHALTTSADFFLNLIIAKVSERSCWPRSTVIPWRRIDCLAILVHEQIKTGLQLASWADSLSRISGNLCPALFTNAANGLHSNAR
jgi:hypothetical protein